MWEPAGVGGRPGSSLCGCAHRSASQGVLFGYLEIWGFKLGNHPLFLRGSRTKLLPPMSLPSPLLSLLVGPAFHLPSLLFRFPKAACPSPLTLSPSQRPCVVCTGSLPLGASDWAEGRHPQEIKGWEGNGGGCLWSGVYGRKAKSGTSGGVASLSPTMGVEIA